jgi:outer membrane protein assembly factor BamB
MRTRLSLLVVGLFLISAVPLFAEDWAQWRGPGRDGISKETGLLKEWPKEGPKLLWQIKDIGYGFSTPSIVGDRLYLLSNKGEESEFVQARSVADGKEIWTTKLGRVGSSTAKEFPGARSTPTVDGDLLYALGSDGDLACVKIADGAIVWRKHLKRDFGGKAGPWNYAESPLVDGDVVACAPGGKQATLIALNKKTGETVWQTALPEADDAAYASAIIVEIGGVRQYVFLLQKGCVGVEARTGKFLWRYCKIAPNDPAHITTPVARDGAVYFSLGEAGGALFKVKAEAGKFTVEHVYAKVDAPTRIGGFILLGDYLYGTKAAGLRCIEYATGAEKWHVKSVGPGALCFADGRLYLHGENGDVALVEPSPEGYREKGYFAPPGQPNRDGAQAWAYPVVANGRLYIRDLGVLWCYDVREAGAAGR